MPVEIFFNQFSGGGGTGGSSFSAGVSSGGNTAGTTGTNAAGLLLVGGTNVSLSQSSAVGGATVTFNVHSLSLNEIQNPAADALFLMNTRQVQFQWGSNLTGFATAASRQGLFEIDVIGATNFATDPATHAEVLHIHQSSNNPFLHLVHLQADGTNAVPLHIMASGSIAADFEKPLRVSSNATVPLIIGTSQSNVVSNLNAFYLQGTSNFLKSAGVSNVGNTDGTTGTVNNGLLLVGGSNITLSQSSAAGGATVSIIGASGGGAAAITLSSYEPYGHLPAAANTGVTITLGLGTNTSGIVYLFPMVIEEYVKAEYMNLVLSEGLGGPPSGTSSGRATQGLSYGLYTRQTGASSTVLSILTSNAFSIGVTGQSDNMSFSYPAQTDTAGFTYSQAVSAGVAISSQFSGAKLLVLPISSIVTPGAYWLGVVQTGSSSLQTNQVVNHSLFGFNQATTLANLAPIGQLSSAYTAGSKAMDQSGGPWLLGHGLWSTANNAALPNSIGLQSISGFSNSTAMYPYVNFWAKA